MAMFMAAKLPGKKDAFRADNIPKELLGNVKVIDHKVIILCVEGIQQMEFSTKEELHNIVIAYEESDSELVGFDGNPVKTGYNCWHKANALHPDGTPWTLQEIDGVFYTTTITPYRMSILSDELPEFIQGAKVRREGDTWFVKTSRGESSAKIGEGLWVRYEDHEDGTISVNILSMSEKSFFQYYLVEDGKMTRKLSEVLGK